MKRIGFDARVGRRVSVGMATYIGEIVARMPHVAPEFFYRVYDKGGNFGFAEQIGLPLRLRRDRIDLMHYLAHYVPYLAGGRFIFTIHDLIHLRFEQYFRAYIGPYYRTVVKKACRNAARIITSDRRTIGDLVHYYGVDPAKIVVIPLAARDRFFAEVEPFKAKRPYILNVGNHREHKDIPTLLAAWSSLPADLEVDLYLTGSDDLGGALQQHSTPYRRAIVLGDVSDDALASYYAGARALVHPALLEGFGLPFVEAMVVGCPVIATTEAIPEPLAPVSLQFEPRDVEGARAQIERLVRDDGLRDDLVQRGKGVARSLTWERTAEATANVYRSVFAREDFS
ncbi:MAG: glycosyltransferase family 4 protein [Vulcanimicrobiaceae bacterium]